MATLRILHPYPALKLSFGGLDYLIVSDLHIGFEERFERAGFKIAPSTEAMLNTLLNLIRCEKPDRLIILGDVRGGFERVSRVEWAQIPGFIERVSREVEVSIIPGNHDGGLTPLLPRCVRIESSSVAVGDTGLLHGHTAVPASLSTVRRLIMGHIHPTYSRRGSPLSGQPVWLIVRAGKDKIFNNLDDRSVIEIWVTPAFNMDLSAVGLTVPRERMISPLLRRVAGYVEDAVVMTLGGVVIGGLESLRFVL